MSLPVHWVPSLAGVGPGDAGRGRGRRGAPRGRRTPPARRRAGRAHRRAGTSVTGAVPSTGKRRLTVVVDDVVHVPEPEPRVTVVQALPKGDRGELAVEVLTEVGVGHGRAVGRRAVGRGLEGRAGREVAGPLARDGARGGQAGAPGVVPRRRRRWRRPPRSAAWSPTPTWRSCSTRRPRPPWRAARAGTRVGGRGRRPRGRAHRRRGRGVRGRRRARRTSRRRGAAHLHRRRRRGGRAAVADGPLGYLTSIVRVSTSGCPWPDPSSFRATRVYSPGWSVDRSNVVVQEKSRCSPIPPTAGLGRYFFPFRSR